VIESIARFARVAGSEWERGRREAGATDPPEPLDEPFDDFNRPLEFLQERARTSYGSLARIETKISTLFAGTIAVLGFVLSHESTPLELAIVLLYLIPLAVLMRGLGVREYSIVPDAETLAASWPYYPKTSVTAIFGAMRIAVEELSENVGIKARLFRRATMWTYGITAFVIVARLAETVTRSAGFTLPPPYATFTGVPSPATAAITTAPMRTP
jgi:hypothetical protein